MGGTAGVSRGAFSGKETYTYVNTGTVAAPAWTEIKRIRNFQYTDGPPLNAVEFHGAGSSGNLPGYPQFRGSFEYVRQRTTDAVYDFLVAARRSGDTVCIRHLNNEITVSGASGFDAPVLLGESSTTANGGDPVAPSFQFGKADAIDDVTGLPLEVVDVAIP